MKVARTTLCGHECSDREAPGLRPADNQGESDRCRPALRYTPSSDWYLQRATARITDQVRVTAALMVWREN